LKGKATPRQVFKPDVPSKGTRNWAGKENMALSKHTDADKICTAEGNTDELEAYALLLAEVQSAQLTGSSQHENLGQWSQIHNQAALLPGNTEQQTV